MSEQAGITGELIYEYTSVFTQVVEYGVSAEGVFSGQTPPPAEGARFDVYFEGPVTGKLRGTVKGVDYLHIRADGRCQLNIHAEITTEDGKKISLAADGVAIPEEGSPVFQLKENVTLTSNHPEYSWVNPIQVWAPGDGRRVEGRNPDQGIRRLTAARSAQATVRLGQRGALTPRAARVSQRSRMRDRSRASCWRLALGGSVR